MKLILMQGQTWLLPILLEKIWWWKFFFLFLWEMEDENWRKRWIGQVKKRMSTCEDKWSQPLSGSNVNTMVASAVLLLFHSDYPKVFRDFCCIRTIFQKFILTFWRVKFSTDYFTDVGFQLYLGLLNVITDFVIRLTNSWKSLIKIQNWLFKLLFRCICILVTECLLINRRFHETINII